MGCTFDCVSYVPNTESPFIELICVISFVLLEVTNVFKGREVQDVPVTSHQIHPSCVRYPNKVSSPCSSNLLVYKDYDSSNVWKRTGLTSVKEII